MKLVIEAAKLEETVRAAKRIPGMRIGQYVFNTLVADSCIGKHTHASRLFYCSDETFREIVSEFITVE
jgi:hypothetical protein